MNGAAPPKMPTAPIWLLGLVTLGGTLGIHIFIPAMALATIDLRATPAAMHLTTSCYVAGLAFGQLVYGPLADRHGRRRVLLIGLALYTIGGIIAWQATSAGWLAGGRLMQALGGCSGMVIARAVVRDTRGAADATRGLATMNLMLTAGPGLAPLIGGFVSELFGWRAITALLVFIGGLNLACVYAWLPETRPPDLSTASGGTLRRYLQLAIMPRFLGYAIGGAFATTSWYAFLGAAPAIFFDRLHQTPRATGIYMGIIVAGVWIGSAIGWRWSARATTERLLISGSVVSLAAAMLVLAVIASAQSVALVTAAMLFLTIGIGVAGPAALSQALSGNDAVVGSASGLYGFIQMGMGAICAAIVNFGSDPALIAAVVMFAAATCAQLMFFIGRRSHLH